MKELSIEQKAKRYDNAYNVAESIHRFSSNPAEIKRMEELFPELKESEDEKIRKHLIKHFRNKSKEDWNGVPVKSVLAWLEKQGVQKQDPCEHCKDRCLNCHNFPCIEKREFEQGKTALEAIKEERVDNANKVEPKFKIGDTIVEKDFDECGYGTIKDIKDGQYIFTDGSGMNINEQNGWQLVKTSTNIKQNPAWSEEDENVLEDIEESIINYWHGDTQDILLDWLKSLKERVQFKQEWSEEDEVKINRIVACLENLNVADNDILLKDIDWLKSLKGRVQPKQQEWGEEDEKRAERLFGWLDTLVNYIHHDAIVSLDIRRERMQQVDRLKTWLYSLRPQNTWKPSDEQIRELGVVATGKGWFSKEILSGLLEQLKKLK